MCLRNGVPRSSRQTLVLRNGKPWPPCALTKIEPLNSYNRREKILTFGDGNSNLMGQFNTSHSLLRSELQSGRAVVNVHAHFLFVWKTDESAQRLDFEIAFAKRFPKASGIERVKHRGKYISYIMRTPDLRPLLDADEYVTYARTVQGCRRMCCYGRFR